jgi:hypothetical protein
MMIKVYSVSTRNRFGTIVFAIAILGLGALFFTVGLALLAGLVAAGGLIGLGVGIARRLRQGFQQLPPNGAPSQRTVTGTLDPSLEILPVTPVIVTPKHDGSV